MNLNDPATPHRPRKSPIAPAALILLNKPYGVLCQFSDRTGRPTLADYVAVPDVYPAGRLDADSEGLVVLTADGALQARITSPRHHMRKSYWVQVEGTPRPDQLAALAAGVRVTGVTVHFVDASLDGGPIIVQEAVPVLPGDTEETLFERIHAVEHRLLPRAVGLFLAGALSIQPGGRTVRIERGRG